jgi:hypothetical protein
MYEQMKHKPIFIDALHDIAANMNSKKIIKDLKQKSEGKFDEELALLDSNLRLKELPLFKLRNFEVLDKGLYVELESNPYFPEIDGDHEKYYNSIMGSLLHGYLNGMSINFTTKSAIQENGIDKINDMDIYGISLVADPALGPNSSITEVVMRSIQDIIETREERKMEKPEQKGEQKIEVRIPDDEINKIVQQRIEEELKKRDIERQKTEQEAQMQRMQKELEDLRKQKEDLEKQKVLPKGFVVQEEDSKTKAMSEEELIKKIRSLTPGEALSLQFDPNIRKILPKLIKVQDYPAGRTAYPRTETRLEPLPAELENYYNALTRRDPDDINLTRRR